MIAATNSSPVIPRCVGFQYANIFFIAGSLLWMYRPKTPLAAETMSSHVVRPASPWLTSSLELKWYGSPAWARTAISPKKLSVIWIESHGRTPPAFLMNQTPRASLDDGVELSDD